MTLSSIISNAQNYFITGNIIDEYKHPIDGSSVSMRSLQDTLYLKGAITDALGKFEIKDLPTGNYKLEVSFIGYSNYTANIKLEKAMNIGTIILKEKAQTIKDVVITAKMVNRFADRKEYKLTNQDKEQYSNALSAMEFLPKIQVLDQDVSSVDGKAVKILINGVPSTPTDLSIISSSNIVKIDYYTHPPVQYSNMGLGAVINVVTKKNEYGGILGINTQNAITTGFGNNVVNFKYNFGNSQIGVTYNINYRNYNKRLLDESLRYNIGEHVYLKEKIGKNSPYAYEEQLAEINFNNSKPENYLFSTKLSFKSLNRRRSSHQEIVKSLDNNQMQMTGESSDKDKYIRPVLDMYFNKAFNRKHEITLNAVGTYYKSEYDYHYGEMYADNADFETSTNLNTNKYSFIGDVIYSLKFNKKQLFLGTRYTYNHSKQENLSQPNRIETNEIYSYIGFTGMLGKKFNYNLSAGVNHNVFTTLNEEKCGFTYFRPQIRFGYFINESSDLTFNYEVDTQTPSISTLTYNPYYKDPNYIYVGNPDLRPSNNHNMSLSYSKGFKKIVISAEIGYNYSKDAIAPIFIIDENNIIETYGNIDYAQNLRTSLFLQWYPFAHNLLRLRLYSEVFHQTNKFNESKWNHTGYVIIPSIMFSYKKWGLQVLYQTKKESLTGQTMRITPSIAYTELLYKPIKNMSVSAGIRYPFYDSWKLTSKTYGTSAISQKETERIINNANMVYISLVYNFSFGKNKTNVKRKINNEDKDSGILNRNN